MSDIRQVIVPDIGDFENVDVVEVLVKPGDEVTAEQPIITLESDKAALDVPTPFAGTIKTLHVKAGDKVSQGSKIADIEIASEQTTAPKREIPKPRPSPSAQVGRVDVKTQLVVIGGGPGGYTAAFRAADLGLDVTLVEQAPTLGGVCLNVGCIPSKALLHAAKVIDDAKAMSEHGINFSQPEINLDQLRNWKSSVVGQLTGGLTQLAKQRNVRIVRGTARFATPHQLDIEHDSEQSILEFEQAVIAVGSRVVKLPFLPDDPRVMFSTEALELPEIPPRLLILGGGIIGMEMGSFYSALGSQVTIVEMLPQLVNGADPDLVRPLQKHVAKRFENIFLNTKVTAMEATDKGLKVSFEGNDAPASDIFDRVLVAVGRRPNGDQIDLEKAELTSNEQGLIEVDQQMRTAQPHIFAIGDCVPGPMLAHKATHQGKVAAEVAAGEKSFFVARVIPAVAYCDPEIAWCGLTESEAKQQKIKYGKGLFPWAASGRALGMGRDEGMTKLIFDEATNRIIGGGIVGPHAGDLIAEIAHAIEMGSDAEDIGLTIHPHPTLSETIAFAAESYAGTITDLMPPRRRSR
ncbi:MAG: dihydrolipoyl dehydrogenase [Pseudomonadota bacterium]|nr:dihydrolipoyl dehydrogenase [Pseudomonadota bacterium]